jgi:phosphoesterase RecJ-like protein
MISKIEKSIKEYKKIALFFHEKPDVDCLASCFAFMKFIKNKFPQKHVVIIGVKDFLGENSDFYANSLFENTSIKNIVNDDDFLKDSLGIILDTANSSRIYNQKYDACARIIVIDHHPIPEQDPTVGAIE